MRSTLMIAGCVLLGCLLWLTAVTLTRSADPAPGYKNKAMSGSRFGGKDLTAADFSYSVITDANFEKAKLRKAVIKYASASDARFEGADLQGAEFRYSVLSDARFRGADCRGADFRHCVLADADFSGADLRGAKFSGPSFAARFDAKTVYDEATKFPEGFDPVAQGLTLRSSE